MSFADTLKGLIFKKPATAAGRDKRDPRQTDEPLEGGRRQGEAENPYLAARRGLLVFSAIIDGTQS